MEKILVGWALPAHAAQLSALFIEAFPDKFGPMLGPEAGEILHDLYCSRPALFTRDTFVATVDGDPVGFLRIGLEASAFLSEAAALFSFARSRYGVLSALTKLLRTTVLEVTPPDVGDELYIKAIGVAAKARGLGVGSALIAKTERVALERRMPALSLHVMADNPKAIRLYERLGFALGPKLRSHLLSLAIGRSGYHKMIKTLRP